MDDPIALDMLATATQKWPGRVAVRSGHDRLTFAELNYAATEIAGRVPNGARIAFRAKMNIATIAALWGVPRGGGVAVPIDPRLDVAEAAVLADTFDATLGWPEPLNPDAVEEAPRPERPVVVVATWGPGGTPRGVLLTAQNARAAADASQIHLGSRPQDSWLLVMPLHHVAGLSILWRAAHDGSRIVLHDGFDPMAVDAELKDDVTWVSLVPTMLSRLLREASGPWPQVRGALVSGASQALVAEANAAGLETLATYGTTETAAEVSTVRPGNTTAAAGTVGHPLPGVEVTIDAFPGQPGAIGIAGPTVSPGNLGESLRSGILATNDIGYFDHSGRLVVVGGGER